MVRTGRPLKFENLQDLVDLADKYFAETPKEIWTITGLAMALDTSRETLMDYEGRADFSDTIKKYKNMVHNAYEEDLRKKGRSGDIFALKNFGWRDQVHNDVTTLGQPILGGLTNVHTHNRNEAPDETPQEN
jgi:hypothetical protein